ncbi:MAG: Smr/MutS family protein [Candidatus Krumholzibacteriia bacterium]
MIELLERLQRADDGGAPVLGDRAARLLEWDRVVDQIARRCLNPRAAAAVRRRRPFADLDAIILHRELADELRPLGDANRWPALADVSGLLDLLERASPLRLEGPDLVAVAAAAENLDVLRGELLELRERCARWGEAAAQAPTFGGLAGAIRRCLDPDGRIADGASPLLARLRRSAAGQERAVRDAVTGAMADAKRQGWATGTEVTLRGDRFCLPLRAGDSRRVPGIVHDRSQTGATLFVEPAAVVSLANRLTETRMEVAAEEARILFELNRAVEQARDALAEAAALLLAVDAARAHLLWSRAVGGQRCAVAPGASLRVCGARHPLLLEVLGGGDLAAGRAAAVPLELEMPTGARALVVSGPNAGGKSVALKTVGVLVLLCQCGWDVPAREDTRLPLVGRVLADLGDDQSIAESLSSFSAHLRHLARFLDEAGPGTLVLCDEIGSGTDPHEGTALAFAVLEDLAARGALVLASTHFGLLKAAVHDHPRMVNAAMDYDDRDLRPLFTFRVGDPGTSHAFDIAARMGLPADLLRRARAMAGEERVQVEKLLADLDGRARELADAGQRTRLAAAEQELLNRQLGERLAGIDKERKETLARLRKDAERAVRDGRRELEAAIREVRSRGADQPSVVTARDRLAELEEQVRGEEERRAVAGWTPAVGEKVRIPHLNLTGRVLEVRGQKIVADADGLRLSLGLDSVQPPDGTPAGSGSPPATVPPPATAPVDAGGWAWHGEVPEVSPELDLRGERAEEGWERLDRLIDRAIPAGLKSIRVIHGFGTGRLRDFLYARLKQDPRVASFQEASPAEGGGGATRVTLAG